MALCKFDESNRGTIYINPEHVVALYSSQINGATVLVLAAQGPSGQNGSQGAFSFEIKLDIDTVASRLNVHG